MRTLILSFYLLAVSLSVVGQSAYSQSSKKLSGPIKKDWHNLDYKESKVYGTSTNKLYQEVLSDKKPKKKIVVAVIDSGVEIDHEDLKDNIWVNKSEIAGNGKDDDENGYIDDVHGWNFLVDENGDDIQYDNLEATRVLRESKKYAPNDDNIPKWLTDELVSDASRIYNSNVDDYKGMSQFAQFYVVLDSILTDQLGKEDYTFDEALELEHDDDPMKSINRALRAFKLGGLKQEDLIEMYETSAKYEDYFLNFEFDPRPELSKGDKYYGNNHYEGPDATHGTHVAGLIAANRNNEIGARGIASEVAEIMVIRAVPDGDERDIDVANAIRYATDNGANIINMSFGKGVSPRKPLVDEAIKYATDNNVLIIHAAGNDSENNDVVANYPNPKLTNGERASSYLTVGASSSSKRKDMVASFSNYGNDEVDLFAPGHEVYSTVPDQGYKSLSGTSMAAPVVSGVAALIWAYHPELSASALKSILLSSATDLSRKRVKKPGSKEKVKFRELCSTGSIVNAYNAYQAATIRLLNE